MSVRGRWRHQDECNRKLDQGVKANNDYLIILRGKIDWLQHRLDNLERRPWLKRWWPF